MVLGGGVVGRGLFIAAAVAFGLLVSGVHGQAPGLPPRYLDEYECIFHRGLDPKTKISLWSWDLYSLRRPGLGEYTAKYADGQGDPKQSLKFNICGTVREVCAPYTEEQGGVLPPFTRGIAIQYLDTDSPPPNSMCIDTNTCDFATDPQCTAPTVQNVSCTSNCEIVAPYTGAAPTFALLDESNPQGGISLRYEGAPAYSGDPFGSCPPDPRTGYSARRSLVINLFCNKAVADFSDMVLTEPSPCLYQVNASAAAACATAGDPFEPQAARDAKNFGWVMLGALVVAPVAYLLFLFVDHKGWLEPIKSRLPACPVSLGFLGGARGGVYGGGGSYKSVSAVGAAGGATSSSTGYGST